MPNKTTPTQIPRVPIQTPMFEDPAGTNEWPWKLNRTWIIFFERIFTVLLQKLGVAPLTRTLLLKDTAPGVSIADHTTIWKDGTAKRVTAVLRKALTADLVVKLWKLDSQNIGAGFQAMVTMTVSQSHPIDISLDFTAFPTNAIKQMHDGDVLRWDVIASDSQIDRFGIAAFTFEWQ